jgi:DNA topoisomerase IB
MKPWLVPLTPSEVLFRRCQLQLPPDRSEVWPGLEELGELKVREMLAKGQFDYLVEEVVEEWLSRHSAADAAKEAKATKRIAIVGAVAAVVAAIASVWQLFK